MSGNVGSFKAPFERVYSNLRTIRFKDNYKDVTTGVAQRESAYRELPRYFRDKILTHAEVASRLDDIAPDIPDLSTRTEHLSDERGEIATGLSAFVRDNYMPDGKKTNLPMSQHSGNSQRSEHQRAGEGVYQTIDDEVAALHTQLEERPEVIIDKRSGTALQQAALECMQEIRKQAGVSAGNVLLQLGSQKAKEIIEDLLMPNAADIAAMAKLMQEEPEPGLQYTDNQLFVYFSFILKNYRNGEQNPNLPENRRDGYNSAYLLDLLIPVLRTLPSGEITQEMRQLLNLADQVDTLPQGVVQIPVQEEGLPELEVRRVPAASNPPPPSIGQRFCSWFQNLFSWLSWCISRPETIPDPLQTPAFREPPTEA